MSSVIRVLMCMVMAMLVRMLMTMLVGMIVSMIMHFFGFFFAIYFYCNMCALNSTFRGYLTGHYDIGYAYVIQFSKERISVG